MKRQDLDKYHNQTVAELQAREVELRQELQQVTLEHSLGKHKNVHHAKNIRTDIARLKTIIHAKTTNQIPSSPAADDAVKSTGPAPKQAVAKKESNV
jgi:ribosomal protein L29